MPVFPAVPSTTVPPGWSKPLDSASWIIYSAARSLTEPPGLRNSALPRISQPVSSLKLLSRMSGVLPTVPTKPFLISVFPWFYLAYQVCCPDFSSCGRSRWRSSLMELDIYPLGFNLQFSRKCVGADCADYADSHTDSR
jgi:hypothetical protein